MRARHELSTTKSWPVAYRWLAVGTIAFYTVVGSRTVNVAMAQELPRPNSRPEAENQPFNIPPGTFDSVLRAFENASGLHVAVPDPGMLNLSSPGVSGVYRADGALEQLLQGTGVDYRFTADRTVTLQIHRLATTVEVTGEAAALAFSTPKYSETLTDTPQTINVVPQSVMEAQNTTTLRDALRNVAGISLAAGEGG